MAQIDPSIAMGFRQPQVQDPIAATMRAQEVGVNALKMQELQRGMQEEQEVRNFLRGADLSKPETRAQLSQFGKTGLGYGKLLAEQEKAGLETKKLGGEISKQDLERSRERTSDLAFNPSDNNIKAYLEDSILRKEMTPEQAQGLFAQVANMPIEQRRQTFLQLGASANERLKQISTPAIREFEFAKTNPDFTQYQLTQKRAGATQVNLPPQEKAEQTERGKFLVEDYKTVTNAARVAARTLPAIEVNLDLLDQGFKTGFGTEVQKGAANILGALGVKNANEFATNAQVFQAKANETVLQRQLEQKGPQTESDAQRITQTSAQLTNTAEANKFILDVAKAQLKRDIEQRNFYDSWFTKNKTYDGAENAWYTGDGGKSLFSRPELKKYNIQTGASPQRSGSQQTTGGLSPAEQAELDSLRKQFNPAKK
jgi:hypothetical protein